MTRIGLAMKVMGEQDLKALGHIEIKWGQHVGQREQQVQRLSWGEDDQCMEETGGLCGCNKASQEEGSRRLGQSGNGGGETSGI